MPRILFCPQLRPRSLGPPGRSGLAGDKAKAPVGGILLQNFEGSTGLLTPAYRANSQRRPHLCNLENPS
jgi:hypothetical protein